jgi:hypothetical protein
MYRNILLFLTIYCKQRRRLVRDYGAYYRILFASFIPDLIKLGKRMSKMKLMRNENKKYRRYRHVCRRIMFDLMMTYSHLLATNGTMIVFDKLVQRLYVFDPEMALLLCNIVQDIIHHPLLGHVMLRDYGYERETEVFFRNFFRIFFEKVTILPFPQKNLSFYHGMFQYICAQSKQRKHFLTISGFMHILVRKLGISEICARINPEHLRILLLK